MQALPKDFPMRLLALFSCLALPAWAQEADPDMCIDTQIAGSAPVAECVNEVLAPCLSLDAATEAAMLCFGTGQEAFGARIADRIAQIEDRAPPEIAAIAKIETKYDLQQNLLQCARLEELRLVRENPGLAVAAATARCQATAVGLAYAKLRLQSRDLDD